LRLSLDIHVGHFSHMHTHHARALVRLRLHC
jgi:hypothetical protein